MREIGSKLLFEMKPLYMLISIMDKTIRTDFDEATLVDISQKLLDCLSQEPLSEPSALRSQLALMVVGPDQSELSREFLRVMNNPRLMLERLKRDGVNPSHMSSKIEEFAISTFLRLKTW